MSGVGYSTCSEPATDQVSRRGSEDTTENEERGTSAVQCPAVADHRDLPLPFQLQPVVQRVAESVCGVDEHDREHPEQHQERQRIVQDAEQVGVGRRGDPAERECEREHERQHRKEHRSGDPTTAERQPHERFDAPFGHRFTNHQMSTDTIASPAYCPAMISQPGTGRPPTRRASACGVRLNHVTAWSTMKANATTLTATITGEAAQSRKSAYAPSERSIARTSSSRNSTYQATKIELS